MADVPLFRTIQRYTQGTEINFVLFFCMPKTMRQHTTTLTLRTNALVSFAANLSLQNRKSAFALMRRALAQKRLPPEFFSEALLHLSLFLGYPPILEGLEVLSHCAKRRNNGSSLKSTRRDRATQGRRLFLAVYGNQATRVLQHLNRLHPGLGSHIVAEPYVRFMSRRGIDLCEREILNVVVLYLHGYDRQLYSHLRGALRTGVPRSVLVDVLESAAFLGRRSSRKVIGTLDRIGSGEAASTF
jgi:alkylhydroperoxidase/carboxymuconolactone decarboxylase family protein YurZ